jgi:hypothetical protein
MCDLSELRRMAEAGPTVTIDSATLLSLIDSVIVITLNEPKQRKKRDAADVDPNDEKCARWLFDVLRKTAPDAKQPNFTTWANDVRLIRERDERTHKEICELFLFAHKHSFWCTNVLSPKTLRKNWDRLAIVRAKSLEPKPAGVGAWWASDATRLAKAQEVGVGPAHYGETTASWEARIRAAIDNGGKPPAPQVFVRDANPAGGLALIQDQIQTPKQRGFLKDMLKQAQEKAAA